MGKYLCERCGKELVFRCAYSKIDNKLICAECDGKEQPKELMKKIADLEAKLAESENEVEEYIAVRDDKIKVINKQTAKINDLKQQLSEKEKKIKKLTKSFAYKNNEDLSTTINGVKFTTEQIIALQQVGYSAEYDRNQTAIAELEKVKELIKEHYNKQFPDFPLGVTEQIHIGIIDQRIKSLKGER